MSSRHSALLRRAVPALALLAACAAPPFERSAADGVFPVPGGDAAHHRLRYVDGQVSLNDTCMIRLGNKLNAKVPPIYVNGSPLGFC